MANHKSAKKRARQTIVKTEQNKAQTSQVKSSVKAVRLAISTNDKEKAKGLVVEAQKLLAKLAQKGVIKKNTAARKTSRLYRQIGRL